MDAVNWQHLVVLAVAIGSALLVYVAVQEGLAELLSRLMNVPGGIVFYRRAFLLMLLFGAAGPAVGAVFKADPGMHFMEYVWAIASGLENVLEFVFVAIALYLVLITILVATLKPKNDQ